jgi:hypothetical protein
VPDLKQSDGLWPAGGSHIPNGHDRDPPHHRQRANRIVLELSHAEGSKNPRMKSNPGDESPGRVIPGGRELVLGDFLASDKTGDSSSKKRQPYDGRKTK